MTPSLPDFPVRRFVRGALREDLGQYGDVTSIATIPTGARSRARMVARETGVICGLTIAATTFRCLDRHVRIQYHVRDGAPIRCGQTLLTVHGHTRSILSAERVALNVVQRLSGIATLTRRFVKTVGSRVRILDTRKTTPLFRMFEKYAVRCGGGHNHRFGLYDLVLIKDNHLAALAIHHRRPILEAVARARRRWPKLNVEVECDTLTQVRDAVEARADILLLDNMTLSQLRRAVRYIKGRAKIEASGSITLKTIQAIARTGVHFISVGALTHSAPSLDVSLEVDGLSSPKAPPSARM